MLEDRAQLFRGDLLQRVDPDLHSPSTRNQDRGLKARRYAELEVAHFWIVDPEHRRIECFRRVGDRFLPLARAEGDTRLVHPDWEGS